MKRILILLAMLMLGTNAYSQRMKFKTDILFVDFNKNEQVEPNEVNTNKNLFKVVLKNYSDGGNKMYADIWLVSENEKKQHYQAEYSDVKIKEVFRNGKQTYLIDSCNDEHLLMFYVSKETNAVSVLDSSYFVKVN